MSNAFVRSKNTPVACSLLSKAEEMLSHKSISARLGEQFFLKAILIITEYIEVIEVIYDTVVNYSLQKLYIIYINQGSFHGREKYILLEQLMQFSFRETVSFAEVSLEASNRRILLATSQVIDAY